MIMVRHAEDDFYAQQIADAMESAGAIVVSIAYNGQRRHFGALEDHSRYIVFARVSDVSQCDVVDAAISKSYDALVKQT